MTWLETLENYCKACCPLLWIRSPERQEALLDLIRLAHKNRWQLLAWDCLTGISRYNPKESELETLDEENVLGIAESMIGPAQSATDKGILDPISAFNALAEVASQLGKKDHALLIFRNAHNYCKDPVTSAALERQRFTGKNDRSHIIGLAPSLDVSPELKGAFQLIDHDLPTRSKRKEIVQSLANADDVSDLDALLDASSGLTGEQTEQAVSLGLVRIEKGEIDTLDAADFWAFKSSALAEEGLLTIEKPTSGFDSVGGLTNLKTCLLSLIGCRKPKAVIKGAFLAGVPGTGKTAIGKALAYETGGYFVKFNLGALKTSAYGGSEQNLLAALRRLDAMTAKDELGRGSRVVVLLDEMEKMLQGAESSGKTDAGTTAGLVGTLLGWFQDRTSEAFILGTCNDIRPLLETSGGAMLRAGRWNDGFFVDFPNREEKDAIWTIYRSHFDVAASEARPEDKDWTGAEIRDCCEKAYVYGLSLEAAAKRVSPVAAIAGDRIEAVRRYADNRLQSASYAGQYKISGQDKAAEPVQRRAIGRQRPGNN